MGKVLERKISWINLIFCVLFLGGTSLIFFQLVSGKIDQQTSIILNKLFPNLKEVDQVQLLRDLGFWMCVTLIFVIVIVIFANILLKNETTSKLASLLLISSGLILLIGTQLIGVIFAGVFIILGVITLFKKS